MTAPARPQTLVDTANDNVAADRAAVTALVGSYRDTLARGLDPLTALACVAGAAYQEMCNRRATQVIAAAVQMLAEMQVQAAHTETELAGTRQMLAVATGNPAEDDCGCRPNEAGLHLKDCPVWVNVGPSLAQRQYVRRDDLPPPMQLCSDKAGPHDPHAFRPDPDRLRVIAECPGIPARKGGA